MTPRVSVFTASHDPRWLGDCYASLVAQTFTDWEWVVLLNGDAMWTTPEADPRVKLGFPAEEVHGVGHAKHHAVGLCQGEILVELDHDDLLLPGALQSVVDTFRAYPDAGLVYSRHADIDETGQLIDAEPYDRAFGWTYQPVALPGRGAGVSPDPLEPLPHNVSLIWTQPNHLRAFTRTAYDKAGGYDPARDVLDDQDLMCRLYQHGPFVLTGHDLLYLQRVHSASTQRDPALNARIQVETVELADRWVQPAALTWAAREGLLALDLGAAHGKPAGYLGVDQHPGPDVDLAGDVLEILEQMGEGTVGVVRAVDFLEHVAEPIPLLNEIWRVLAHGGMLLSLTPSTDGRGAWADPTHRSWWNELSPRYYTHAEFAAYVPEIRCRFQTSRLLTYFPTAWHEEQRLPYLLWNASAVKGGPRVGGLSGWPG